MRTGHRAERGKPRLMRRGWAAQPARALNAPMPCLFQNAANGPASPAHPVCPRPPPHPPTHTPHPHKHIAPCRPRPCLPPSLQRRAYLQTCPSQTLQWQSKRGRQAENPQGGGPAAGGAEAGRPTETMHGRRCLEACGCMCAPSTARGGPQRWAGSCDPPPTHTRTHDTLPISPVVPCAWRVHPLNSIPGGTAVVNHPLAKRGGAGRGGGPVLPVLPAAHLRTKGGS